MWDDQNEQWVRPLHAWRVTTRYDRVKLAILTENYERAMRGEPPLPEVSIFYAQFNAAKTEAERTLPSGTGCAVVRFQSHGYWTPA